MKIRTFTNSCWNSVQMPYSIPCYISNLTSISHSTILSSYERRNSKTYSCFLITWMPASLAGSIFLVANRRSIFLDKWFLTSEIAHKRQYIVRMDLSTALDFHKTYGKKGQHCFTQKQFINIDILECSQSITSKVKGRSFTSLLKQIKKMVAGVSLLIFSKMQVPSSNSKRSLYPWKNTNAQCLLMISEKLKTTILSQQLSSWLSWVINHTNLSSFIEILRILNGKLAKPVFQAQQRLKVSKLKILLVEPRGNLFNSIISTESTQTLTLLLN